MIKYPFIPEGREILYVEADNEFMRAAKEAARELSLDNSMPTGSVVVKDGAVLGRGANGSDFHQTHVCERVKRGIPTGQGYELCEGCHPKNHSEPRAIKDAQKTGVSLEGADLYLWGHWWACEPCWDAIRAAGIARVFLMLNSEVLFNREHPGNIVGRQLE